MSSGNASPILMLEQLLFVLLLLLYCFIVIFGIVM